MARIGGAKRRAAAAPAIPPSLLDEDDERAPPKELPPEDLIVDLGEKVAALPSSFEVAGGTVREANGPSPFEADQGEHFANLALQIDEDELRRLGEDIVAMVEADIEERSAWRERFERGLEMMGLIESDIDDGPFPGASTAVHPLLAEAVTQFWARAMSELFPAEGPAKGKVYGEQTQARIAASGRVAEYLNYEMTELDEGYMAQSSSLLWALPFHGSCFRKTYRDPVLNRTIGIYVPAEDFILPAEAGADLRTTPRYTHRMYKSANALKRLQLAGHYRDIDLGEARITDRDEARALREETVDIEPDETRHQLLDGEDDTSEYELFETCLDLDLPGFAHLGEDGEPTGLKLSYTVTVDRASREVLSIYRTWAEGDALARRKVHFTRYDYVPGHGSYGYGLLHLIGGLQVAATGALRVLLDGAASASLSGGFVAKNSNLKGQRFVLTPGEWQPVDATAEDLARAFFAPPVKEPSQALFNLMGFLTQAAQRFTSTTELLTGEGDAKGAPVGSVVAMIEQGQKVMSTIHRMAHGSLASELKLRFELARHHVTAEGYPYEIGGDERMLFAEDFGPRIGIVPVADPNIFSSVQRIAMAQSVYQIALENPDVVPKHKAIKRLLQAMKVPDVDDLLPDPKQPMPLDPVAENQAMLMMMPATVFPDQDHGAHIEVHLQFMMSPGFGGNPHVAEVIGPVMQAHIGQHLAYLYGTHMRSMGVPAPFLDPTTGQPMGAGAPPEQIAQMAAQVAAQVGQMPGLPMPPQPQDTSGQEQMALAQAKLQLQEQSHEQQMRHAEDKHQLDMRRAQEKSGLEAQGTVQKHMLALKTASDQAHLAAAERTDKALHDKAKRDLEMETATMRTEMETAAARNQAQIDESVRRSEALMKAADHQMGRENANADFEMRQHDRAADAAARDQVRQSKNAKLRE